MKTVLHVCCGPCASACVPRLRADGHEVTMLFANSNIDTREEFEKRKAEAEKLARHDGVAFDALPYDHGEWLREVAAGCEDEPEKGARCVRCFRYNLQKAADYAAAHGIESFTTSLTVSPHKVSGTIFGVAQSLVAGLRSQDPSFLPYDFKKKEGFKLSTRRAKELGLYRQAYCGCEFSRWRVHHRTETVSTQLDARGGSHGDVYVADFQTAGRGRLDHLWQSPPGANLMMSTVLSVEGLDPEHVATFPLVAGLAVVKAVDGMMAECRDKRREVPDVRLKWPNDVLAGGRKIAGILCERHGDNVIVGMGVNVSQTAFPPELAARATSLARLAPDLVARLPFPVLAMRTAVLASLAELHSLWREKGFAAVYPEIAAIDLLKGREIAVRQTDDDAVPVAGVSGGIMPDGSLDVGGTRVYAGEAHVERT